MLLIEKTIIMINTGNALGFCTGSGQVIPFSVDPSVFCGNFRVGSKTPSKIFIDHDGLLINEVHNLIEGNNLFKILTTNGHKIIFWTQNKMNCKLCRIIRRDLCFVVAAHCVLQKESYSFSTKLSTEF